MSIEITFLGTSSMVPTKDRNVQSIHLSYEGEGILFDCGEGTQRQMNIAGINRLKVKKIFISHWHGDHVSGLIGLIQTIGNTDYPDTLEIYGPEGTKGYMKNILNSCIFDLRINLEVKEFNIKNKKKVYEGKKYYVEAIPLEHGVPCVGYAFVEKDKRRVDMNSLKKYGLKTGPLIGKLQKGMDVEFKSNKISFKDVTHLEKGKKITIIMDTKYTSNCEVLAKDADLLISEATYSSERKDKAEEYNHMTAEQAAFVANNAGVKELILTHFSQRYKVLNELKEEAEEIFPNVKLAFDFMKIKM